MAARWALPLKPDTMVTMTFVSVHLDHRSPWRRGQRSLGVGRREQARVLVQRYGGEEAVVLGGDLNTWFGGKEESAFRILKAAFPLPPVRPDVGTAVAPWILPDLVLDHLFFRLPEALSVSYEVVMDRYGSDHRPLLARIRLSSKDPESQGMAFMDSHGGAPKFWKVRDVESASTGAGHEEQGFRETEPGEPGYREPELLGREMK